MAHTTPLLDSLLATGSGIIGVGDTGKARFVRRERSRLTSPKRAASCPLETIVAVTTQEPVVAAFCAVVQLSYSSLTTRLDLNFRRGEFVGQPGCTKPLRLRDTSGSFCVLNFTDNPCCGVCLHFLLVWLRFEDGVD
jgi:hypothetical protein